MNKKISLLLCFLVVGSAQSFAWHDYSKSGSKGNTTTNNGSSRANCAPAVSRTNLALNNVRALIETGGNLWQDRSTGNASYEVPAGAGTTAIFAGALWLGGEDVNGQLKIAAVDYRESGNDFWPGPLTVSGDAEITPDVCAEYDQFFEITRQEVSQFNAWYECVNDPTGDCNPNALFPNYQVPAIINEWPAHGDPTKDQDFYLAPFYDRDGNGIYEPSRGDYPDFDIRGEGCDPSDRTVRLFGDQTYWWVFNDKGNIHTETGGDPVGMEIRAQAFAFTTNDEVNNMTFYNYELINRSTQTLSNTYFGQWVDPDLGCSGDDYVGCDVKRGLGYCYNADAVDDDVCSGALPYGANPPAIGIDFFEGPYKDNDGIDNPGPTSDNNFFVSYGDAIAGDGITYKGMGIGYGDQVVDNERFGMRKFMIYTGGSTPGVYGFPQTDPDNAIQHYRYLQGQWQNGDPLVYGGGGYQTNPGADPNIPCDYAFPGDSDPQGFGAGGVTGLFDWSEVTNANPKGDRRFMQSAGPFTLEPGAVNNITVGAVYARSSAGGLFASVDAVRLADDKAQALFDNCFQILEGPDAPDVVIQEMDKEIIIYLGNTKGQSNNYVDTPEDYEIEDPFIITPDSLLNQGISYDNKYRFEGYQIFQLKNKDVSPSELTDIDKARLVAQCDIKNGVDQLINWTFNEGLGVPEPEEMVNGADEGIKHSFKITEDEFAEGDRALVNHKKYYYMAIAYGYNNYKTFSLLPDSLDGQQKPYIASRKNGQGGEIKVYTGIPHIQAPEADGTINQAEYGDSPEITRREGMGNGSLFLDFTEETENLILANNFSRYPTYKENAGPVNIKVIDPLNVVDGQYKIVFKRDKSQPFNTNSIGDGGWEIIRYGATSNDTVFSDKSIAVGYEQLIPEWGISVEIEQINYETIVSQKYVEFLDATIEYSDSSQQWLSGVSDADGQSNQNWIRSGTVSNASEPDGNGCDPAHYNDNDFDPEEHHENSINGTWAPFKLVGVQENGTSQYPCVRNMPIAKAQQSSQTQARFEYLNNVDIVFTSDKSKWTRCMVLEMSDDDNLAEGGADKMKLREAPSVDKEGRKAGEPGYNAADGDLTATTGMGWFPGYAIDLETGKRLNMAFAEDSWLGVDNGRDMIWNPTSTLYSGFGEPIFGGKHYVYVFTANDHLSTNNSPAYDACSWAHARVSVNNVAGAFKFCTWVGMPMLANGFDFDDPSEIPSTARIRLRVQKAYDYFPTQGSIADSAALSENNWAPVYEFNTGNIATLTANVDTAVSALDLINIVPNPYYAYSQYEENRLDNRVKITNLPEQCVVTIYTANGTLVRQFDKDDPLTSIDWDLKNFKGIPIASGTYIIHIKADNLPGEFGDVKKRANERVIKWFGVTRPPDLENF